MHDHFLLSILNLMTFLHCVCVTFCCCCCYFFFMNEKRRKTLYTLASWQVSSMYAPVSYWKVNFRHTLVGELSWSYPRWNNFRSLSIEGWRKLLTAGAPWDAQINLEVLAVFLDFLIGRKHFVQGIKPQIKTPFGAT